MTGPDAAESVLAAAAGFAWDAGAGAVVFGLSWHPARHAAARMKVIESTPAWRAVRAGRIRNRAGLSILELPCEWTSERRPGGHGRRIMQRSVRGFHVGAVRAGGPLSRELRRPARPLQVRAAVPAFGRE